MVLRPDSGDPVQTVVLGLRAAEKVFGCDINSKGFKVPRGCSVIQGVCQHLGVGFNAPLLRHSGADSAERRRRNQLIDDGAHHKCCPRSWLQRAVGRLRDGWRPFAKGEPEWSSELCLSPIFHRCSPLTQSYDR